MKLFNRIVTILMIISLQACGVGTQSLLGNLGSKPNTSGPAVGPALSQTIEQAEQEEKQAADAPTRTLDIVVPTFDAGLAATKVGDAPVWSELRRAEANLFAVELKNALERTEKFGAVRVTPDRSATAAIYVMGRIAESKGHKVEIDLAVADISGRDLVDEKSGFSFGKLKPKMHNIFKTKSFSHDVDEKFFKNLRQKNKQPYQPIFDEVAAFVVELLETYDNKQVNELNKLTDMRFAASFSEDAFAEHMETKQGRVILSSLPSEDDSMYQKVRAIRVRDQLFVDQLQTDYEQFAAKIAPSYRLWQEQTLTEYQAQRQAKKDAAKKALGAVLMLGLAVAAGSSAYDDNYDAIGDTMAATGMVAAGMISAELAAGAIKSAEEAKMHNELIKELGDSVEIDVAPKVVVFEEKEKELVGNAKEQFAQWRTFLKTIYELEKTPIKTL